MTGPDAAREAFTCGLRAWMRSRGINPDSPGLVDTPDRVLRALDEFTTGYEENPADHLLRTFEVDHPGGIIAVSGVPFTSLCEHHLLPFAGTATIAYLPEPHAPVVGLSKLPRVLDVYARRLQTQEKITRQVTAAMDAHLKTLGSVCILRSEHGCLTHRGARKAGATMVTASHTGVFLTDAELRADLHRMLAGEA